MEESIAKVLSFVFFIVLGHMLRRWNVLRPEAFHAVSGLVVYVTIPCVIFANLNGISIVGDMLWLAIFGLATNFFFLGVALLYTWREKNPQLRDFTRLNMGGYSCGPFALPYIQAFYPATGVLTVCMFDVGNVVMSGGGTYALIAGSRAQTTFLRTVWIIVKKLFHSGPFVSFAFMVALSIFSLKLPESVITCAKIGASANTFLCMIMIGESIDFSMSFEKFVKLLRILAVRWVACIILALVSFYLLPFEEEIRIALMLTCLAPIPAMSLIFTAQLEGDVAMGANLNSMSVACSVAVMSIALILVGAG